MTGSMRSALLALMPLLQACNEMPGGNADTAASNALRPQWSAPASSSPGARWLADSWHALDEPAFTDADASDSITVLRFLWMPSFDPTIVVRVLQQGAHCSIFTLILGQPATEWGATDSMGVSVPVATHPGSILRRDSSSVPASTCTALKGQFAFSAYWSASPTLPPPTLDGSLWVLERLDAAGHRALIHQSPDSLGTPALWQAGTSMLRAAHALPGRGKVY